MTVTLAGGAVSFLDPNRASHKINTTIECNIVSSNVWIAVEGVKDMYTKVMMTLIALSLFVIAFNLTIRPDPAVAFLGSPTFGDLMVAMENGEICDRDAAMEVRCAASLVMLGTR